MKPIDPYSKGSPRPTVKASLGKVTRAEQAPQSALLGAVWGAPDAVESILEFSENRRSPNYQHADADGRAGGALRRF